MKHGRKLVMSNRLFVGVILLLTHETVFAHNPLGAMVVYSGILLIPGAIAASIVKEKRVWWFLASIPLMVISVWLAFSATTISPYIYLSFPFLLIPLAIFQNKRVKIKRESEVENAS